MIPVYPLKIVRWETHCHNIGFNILECQVKEQIKHIHCTVPVTNTTKAKVWFKLARVNLTKSLSSKVKCFMAANLPY